MASDAWEEGLAVLQEDVGTWDAEVAVSSPGAPPSHARGVSRNHLGCGGRWLVVDFEADSGFSGHGVYGYDPARSAYVGLWVDNMRNFAALSEGTWDAASRTMSYVTEATVGGRAMRWREVTEYLGADRKVMRIVFPDGQGGEQEMMKISYRRRPA